MVHASSHWQAANPWHPKQAEHEPKLDFVPLIWWDGMDGVEDLAHEWLAR